MATWTAPTDRATNDVITSTIWNQSLGADGNMLFAPTYYKVKTAAQSWVATTTYADVTASSGNMGFSIAASEAWEVEWLIYVSTAVAGGFKFQITGPASPTTVQAGVGYQSNDYDGTTGQARGWVENLAAGTAFSSNLVFVGGGAGNSDNQRAGGVRISALIVNGANAGTVTLQCAQGSASGTTTIDRARMFARRLITA